MFATSLTVTLTAILATETMRPLRWEKEVAGIEKRIAGEHHAEGGVVFAGSSSIRLWNLTKSFPDQKYVNAGFGGSEIRDSTQFADRLIVPHQPKTIVFYAGDNDIANKRTPAQLRDDFAAFVKHIHAKLPKTRILYLPVKPSLARWKMYDVQQSANGMIRAMGETDPLLTYVDTVPVTLGADGRPKPEFFQKDGLHMNDTGYAAWSAVVKKALE
ncbi:GDSL-type esterase/lipase family protein [Limnoglobus roseus]|uniref:GDSL family lipase n=1 Tax=Limnoglobus roseus TaxID=2598579 RepID=A0A5C1A527_9BACT|nr:GDSL-type esterase/lipase family protein [Limnoglobus roseus]QEL13443.1 GDSL family lipase [Limnoglobus roseus]